MTEIPHRRQRMRLSLHWKAAVAFAPALGRAIAHTQTQDLSASGAAIFSDYADLTGTEVTLLLALPARTGEKAPNVLKMRARVVSTVRTPDMAQYRHGLTFIRSPHDGLDDLDAMLTSITPQAPSAAVVAAASADPITMSTPSRRLNQLKQLAQIRLAEEKANAPAISANALINDALERSYRYLKDLAEQLNVVHPDYPKSYAIAGVAEFNGLVWETGRVDFYTRELSLKTKLYDRVALRFVLSAKKQIHLDREYPASENLRRILTDSKIEFTATEVRNARGYIERITFDFPCKVAASVQFSGQFDMGKILLHTSNVSGFGVVEQILAPEAITEEALDEFSAFILGETKALSPLLLRNAAR